MYKYMDMGLSIHNGSDAQASLFHHASSIFLGLRGVRTQKGHAFSDMCAIPSETLAALNEYGTESARVDLDYSCASHSEMLFFLLGAWNLLPRI